MDFYASSSADPSGFGEGWRYLGSTEVTTDVNGNATFEATLATPTVAGETLSATASYLPALFTSEFSNAVTAIYYVNLPPILDPIDNQSVDEGSTLHFTASAHDPDDDILTYSLVDAPEGMTIDSGSGVVTWTPVDGTDTSRFDVTIQVVDSGVPALDNLETITVVVTNVALTLSLSGPANAVRYEEIELNLAASDPSIRDAVAEFAYHIDWGDGSDPDQDGQIGEVHTGLATAQRSHVFETSGTYTVTVQAVDKDGGISPVASHTLVVNAIAYDGQKLILGGTAGDDEILITRHGESVGVRMNGVVMGTFEPSECIDVYGGAGDDLLRVQGDVDVSVWLDGGYGND